MAGKRPSTSASTLNDRAQEVPTETPQCALLRGTSPMTNKTIVATLVTEFERKLEGKTPVAHGVGLDGSLYVVISLTEAPRTVQQIGATVPKGYLDVPIDYRV